MITPFPPHRNLVIAGIVAFLLFSAGCAQISPPEGQTPPPTPEARQTGPELLQNDLQFPHLDEKKIRESALGRAGCYHLQPQPVTKNKKGRRISGRCQPQSLVYARCRTGFTTCKAGDTSPVQWFACARSKGFTTPHPTAGSVMILAGNAGRRMATGHPVYVEQIKANGDGTWLLRISHTNYDRQCHLDLDAKVRFNPAHMTASFQSGPWGAWATDLKVLGFILR